MTGSEKGLIGTMALIIGAGFLYFTLHPGVVQEHKEVKQAGEVQDVSIEINMLHDRIEDAKKFGDSAESVAEDKSRLAFLKGIRAEQEKKLYSKGGKKLAVIAGAGAGKGADKETANPAKGAAKEGVISAEEARKVRQAAMEGN